MADPQTLRDQWDAFERDVLPASAGRIQRLETRRAFYAGMGAMMHLVVATSELPEEEAIARMQALNDEMGRWLDLLRSRAV